MALATAFVVWLVVGNDDDGDQDQPAATVTGEETPPRAATREELVALSRSLGYPVYWAGPQPGRTYELTRTRSGRVYIRYLPREVEVGNRRPRFLTVGTYPQANGYTALRAAARRESVRSTRASGGAFIVFDRRRPRSAYFSFPNASFQVEVFHPTPRRARALTLSGRIRPVS